MHHAAVYLPYLFKFLDHPSWSPLEGGRPTFRPSTYILVPLVWKQKAFVSSRARGGRRNVRVPRVLLFYCGLICCRSSASRTGTPGDITLAYALLPRLLLWTHTFSSAGFQLGLRLQLS